MTKSRKILLASAGAVLAVLVVAALVLPAVLKDRVTAFIERELDERLDATVTFEDVDLALVSTFPALTAEVVSLRVVGRGQFDGKTLLSVKRVGVGLNLITLLRDEGFVIESVVVDEPVVQVEEAPDGAVNYDILKAHDSSEDEASEAVELRIRNYEIKRGAIEYQTPDVEVSIAGLDHAGSAAIGAASQTLRSTTTIKSLTAKLGRVSYLRDAEVAVDVGATLLPSESRLEVERLAIRINSLSANGEGTIAWPSDALDLDVSIASGKGQSIKALVSALPKAYAGDLKGVKASGQFSLGADVKGPLGPDDDDIPTFSAYLRVVEGSLQYPDLPLPLSDIAIDATVSHVGGSLDKMRVDVAHYAVSAGRSRASGSVEVTRPISRTDLTAALDGRFHMDEIAKAYPLPDVAEVRGLVTTKMNLVARGENIERLEGTFEASNVEYVETGAPKVAIPEARIVLSPKGTRVETLQARVGRSDASISGTLSPITALLDDEKPMAGSLRLESQAIVVDDFISDDGASAEDAANDGETTAFLLPDNVLAALTVDVDKLVYDELVLTRLRGKARLGKRTLSLKDLRANAIGGSMKISGTIATPVGQPATFDLRYSVDRASFAEAFEALPSMRAYAPIARFLDGRFSADIEASGQLGDDGSPKLRSVDADGLVVTLQSRLGSDFKPLAALSSAVPAIPKPLDLSSLRTRFHIEDGAMQIRPFEVRSKGIAMQVSGSHGLDQEMDYRIGTKLPANRLTGRLVEKVQSAGVNLGKLEAVDVGATITGSITNPRVSVDVDTDALRGAVADAASAELEKQRQQALAFVAAHNKAALAQAEKRAAQIRTEGRKAAERVRKEGYKRADQLVEEAGSNSLAQLAAKEASKRARRETDKRADQLVREADRRADQAVAEAKKRAAQLEAEADARSKRAGDQATGSIR
ncbi:MAG: AsmA-like C-terminal region-containing protein [Myxococcota bacterium]